MRYSKIKKIEKIKLNTPISFYDITVDKYSNFSIGKSNIIVHNSSLASSINKITRTFGCSSSLLTGSGYFGTSVKPEAAASRYTSVKMSPFTKSIIKENEKINVLNAEGGYDWLHVEVPLGLCTHIVGIAVGYSSNILPRKLDDVVAYLDGKNKQLRPYFLNYKGSVKKHDSNKSWLFEGVLEIDDKTMTIKVGDLPPLTRYDSFIKNLNIRLNDINESYKIENNSSDQVDVTIKWRDSSTWQIVKDMVSRMTKMIVVEGLVFVKDGSVIEYEELSDYLDDFKVHRERVRYKKMLYELSIYNDELDYLKAKVLFMKFMMEKKHKQDEIKEWMKSYKPKIRQRLDSIRLTALTTEHLKETEDAIKQMIDTIKEQIKKSDEQAKKCKALEKGYVQKGTINMSSGRAVSLLDDFVKLEENGIEVYNPDSEEIEDEQENTEEDDQ